MRKILLTVLLLFIFIRPLNILYNQRGVFFSSGYEKKYESLKTLYYSSQYVKKDNPNIIPDNTLEAFAGGVFLKGLNPILIVHDQPPLGRYIIGLSIYLFDNPSTVTIPLLAFTVLGIFLISKIIIGDTIYSLLPIAIFVNEPLFLNKFVYTPLLEPIQLPFIIFSVYFFIKGVTERKYNHWFILCSSMLGFVISIRFFILGAGIVLSMLLYLLSQRVEIKRITSFLISLPLAVFVLLLAYTKTIVYGYSFLQILGIQKYILVYHSSKFTLPLSFWDLLLFNRWHTWWGDRSISFDLQWNIVWPISVIFTILYFVLALGKKIVLTNSEKIIYFYLLIMSIMLSFGFTSTRYFLPFLPFLYILAVAFLKKTNEKIFS